MAGSGINYPYQTGAEVSGQFGTSAEVSFGYFGTGAEPVSYTHLTLPTNREV